MASTQAILKVVSRVTGRVRFWRIMEALVQSAMWCLFLALPLFILDMIVPVHWLLLLAPVVGFVALFVVFAAKRLSGVSRYEVAKVVDDQMGLKDRLTSALYFERLGDRSEMAQAAVSEAEEIAATLDLGKLALGTWPKRTGIVAALAAVTAILAVGPLDMASWFRGLGSSSADRAAKERREADGPAAADPAVPKDAAAKVEPRKPITEIARLETDRPPERDPNSMDTSMSEDLQREIDAIKGTIDMKDMKDMADAFKDDPTKPKDPSDSKPPPIAPLDQGLLDDIARSEKTKSDKGDSGKEDAIGVAVKMPSKPGAKSQGIPKKGGGGHGGGDVGESGDTRGAARRIVPLPAREKLVVDSRKSTDVVEKTDLEKSVMTEVMMRWSMKDVEMTAKAVDVPVSFKAQPRESALEETIPPGLRGYVQRYFEGLAPRAAASAPAEAEATE